MKNIKIILTYIFILVSCHYAVAQECRKDTVIVYSFVPGSEAKTLSQRHIHTYNEDNIEITSLRQNWDEQHRFWVNSYKLSKEVDEDGNILKSTDFVWSIDDNTWVRRNKTTSVYTDGLIVSYLSEKWNETSERWDYSTKSQSMYNANDDIVEQISHRSTDGTTWIRSNKNEYSYDSEGRLSQQISLRGVDNNWVNSARYLYSYDGNTEEKITQFWSDPPANEWWSWEKEIRKYDATNHLTLYEKYSWNGLENTWIGTYKNTYGEVLNGTRTNILYTWDDVQEIWLQFSKTEVLISNTGKASSSLSYRWIEAITEWRENKKVILEYDQNDSLISSKVFEKGTDSWVPDRETLHEYTETGTLHAYEIKTRYNMSTESWEGRYREEYICTLLVDETSSIEPRDKKHDLHLYPNPVAGSSITIKTDRNDNYNIYNHLNALVASGDLVSGENEISIPQYLSNGIYYIKTENRFSKLILRR